MKEYLMTLMGVALLNGIVGMLSPEGELKKYVRLLGACCLICAIAQPVFSLLSEGNWKIESLWEGSAAQESEAYEQLYEDILLSGSERYAAETVKRNMMEHFELSDSSFDVSVWRGEDGETALVTVTLRDEAIFADPHNIIAYIKEVYECSCTVIYD